MAKIHSGSGEFKGSGNFTAALADVVTALDSFEVQKSVPSALRDAMRVWFDELGKRSADFMGKVAELKDMVTQLRDENIVNFGLADIAQRGIDTTRADLSGIRALFLAMNRRVHTLEVQVRELEAEIHELKAEQPGPT